MNKKQLNENIKIAAFDIDGTLLEHGHLEFNDTIINMFEQLHKRGIKTVLASAREFVTIGKLLDKPKTIDYFIGANGAFCYDVQNQKLIFEKPIEFEDFKILYETFNHFQPCNSFLITDINYGFKSPDMDTNTWFLKPHNDKLLDMDYSKIEKDHLHIITLGSLNHDDSVACAQKADEIFKEHNMDLEVTAKWSKGVFIGKKGITKSKTLNWLCNYLGFDRNKNLIAFGDSSNDYEMLRDAAYGVAMNRANDWVKSVAKDTTVDCDQNGVYLKLKELGLVL
ncbi:YcsE-related riboflavin metabolism phosphatase [Mycoplasmopsis primatum]|uniref:YcsE-related riboflavin metabolism phosphatase n=1 Tax=Mycoplasmopsis primatum TaxID=55604 RepID=UPI0004970744|nr:HAD family hydrolase [Mycoplasmopsis primatum]